MFRLLDGRHPPEHIVLENVPFIVHLEGGATLRRILKEFESRRYRWAYRIVDTSAFGIPQRRRRFVLIASRSLDPAALLLAEDAAIEAHEHDRVTTNGFYWTEGNRGIGWAINAVPPLKVGSSWGIASPPAFWARQSGGIYTPRIRGAELLQGFRAGWTEVKGSGVGGPARARWKMVGNAVSVPLAEWIARRIILQPNVTVEGCAIASSDRLPRAAFYDGKTRYKSQASSFPVVRRLEPLATFLKRQYQPLSHDATRGFRLRYEASGLRKNPAFIDALRRHERGVA
jgi:DNA (cytosine-5)-methyltransferase 1